MKETTTNVLVPKLLDKINNYAQKLKNRVKIDTIFNEFDENANENFKKFIEMSGIRYKSVKSGNSLQNILKNQKAEYTELSNQILNNQFYNNNEIEAESKKLLKKMSTKENKDLYKLRKEILFKSKDFTKSEIRNREKYYHNALIKRKIKGRNKSYKTLSRKDLTHKLNHMEITNNSSVPNMPKISSKKNNFNFHKEELLEKKKYFDDLMEKDYKNFNDNILDYKNYLKDVENTHKEGDPLKLNNNKDNYGHTYNFSPDNIKLLTYKEEEITDNKPKKKQEPQIDIMKLMRYTKRGNKKWFEQELKFKSKIRTEYMSNKHEKLGKSRSLFNSGFTQENFYHKEKGKETIPTDENSITHTTNFTNFKNTIKTVRNEADKTRYINENFDKKKTTLEGFFKKYNLPKLEDYDNMIKYSTIYYENKTHNNDAKKNYGIKNSNEMGNDYDKNKYLAQKEIFNMFSDTYHKKKELWEEEDEKRDLLKKKNEEDEEEIKNYLKEIKNIGRKPNLFVDPYSNRDGNINKLIKVFNKTLTGGFYSKKKMESKIDEFNNRLEIREKEKKLHEELMNKKLCEEEKKKREEDVEYQVLEKMKKNLDSDNNNEESKENENIDFNYKFFLSKDLVKNKSTIDPYQDYKEFFDIITEKKKKQIEDERNKILKKNNANTE